MLLLRARALQHGDEVDSSANANLQLPQAQLPLLQVDDPSRPPRPPQARQIVPCRILPHPDSSYPITSPSTQPLARHTQNTSNTLPEPRSRVFQLYPPQCPNVNHQGPRWPTHLRLRIWSLLSRSCFCSRPRYLCQTSHLSPATPRSTTTLRVRALY